MGKPYLRDESVSRNPITRRQAITAVTAAAIVPTTAQSEVIDPHIAWLEEWLALDAQYAATDDDGHARDLTRRMNVLIDLIVETPARTPIGIAAKLEAVRKDTLVYVLEDEPRQMAVVERAEEFLRGMT